VHHEDATALLPDLCAGRLTVEHGEELKRHLDGCADCRERLRALEPMHAAFREERLHPSSSALVDFALEPSRLAPQERNELERHFDDCANCMDELRRIRETEASARRSRPARTAGAGHRWRLAIAAAIAGFAILLGADVILRLSGSGAQPDLPGTGWSGAVPLTVLSGTLRGADGGTQVEIPADQPFVVLAVQMDSPEIESAIRFEIQSGDGDPQWSTELPASRVRRDLGAQGVITLLVPEARIPTGECRLVVIATSRPQPSLVEVDFRTVR